MSGCRTLSAGQYRIPPARQRTACIQEEKMAMRPWAALSICAVATVVLGAAVPRAYPAADAATSDRSITVSADGQAMVRPDVAFVSVGVQQNALEAAKA